MALLLASKNTNLSNECARLQGQDYQSNNTRRNDVAVTSQIEQSMELARKRNRPLGFISGLVLLLIIIICLLTTLIINISRLIWDGQPVLFPAISNTTVPMPLHSHNDYWREIPLHSAITWGCIGVEADVWAFENELYVGHSRGDLSPGQKFSNMYVDPLLELLQRKSLPKGAAGLKLGVYDVDPGQTMVLLVDLKSDATITWPLLLEKLEPLRERGWLTRSTNEGVSFAPVTVVVAGNVHLDMVLKEGPLRDVFLDAPLNGLEKASYNATNSYYASASFYKSIGLVGFWGLRQSQLSRIRDQVRNAHDRGLKARYWNLPTWPIQRRNYIWDILVKEGVDILNVDDVGEASQTYLSRYLR